MSDAERTASREFYLDNALTLYAALLRYGAMHAVFVAANRVPSHVSKELDYLNLVAMKNALVERCKALYGIDIDALHDDRRSAL